MKLEHARRGHELSAETRAKISASLRGPRNRSYKHGRWGTPEYKTWECMKYRCEDPRDASYARYGGRGITVCEEWRYDFMAFYQHVGPKPGPEYSIDRIDNDGNYEPGNVRWSTRSEQRANQRPRAAAARAGGVG